MAKIYPFAALSPVSGGLDLKPLLEGVARQRPEISENQQMAYHSINETWASLLANGTLRRNPQALYVYELKDGTSSHTGIWALADLYDQILTHEATFDDSVRRLRNYREATGIEGSPVLLTYSPSSEVEEITQMIKSKRASACYQYATEIHSLWCISDPEITARLTLAFDQISQVFLADGHHRILSAQQLLPKFNRISALFMNTSELRIRRYDRVVVPYSPVDKKELFRLLMPNFYLHESFSGKFISPDKDRHVGLYIDGGWYHMVAKPRSCSDCTDAELLQEKVFGPLFGISDPSNDTRLKHFGGKSAPEQMQQFFSGHPQAIGFTLCPVSTEQLIAAALAGRNLPPKATWIDPKIPYGLLINHHEQP
ncbi:DUF1015 family protein [Mucilaginibacter aquariorum]|uniref:DUF1015 family protein n=1 Tax=Mucilaginibacter aquariorum TaxID=2967225 RepID=A0ABT1SZ91_9SPHI|nr:DUF1015 family protein [Mucilaginibacter aquariorum]MCQ6957669.1 DUF1015 family protein [Mucilaginibacter aquariorum]